MSLWESMLLAALGGLIATVASLATTWMQNKAAARARAEQFEREDKYRLYQERIQAYARFHHELSGARRAMLKYSRDKAEAHKTAAIAARDAVFDASIPIVLIGHSSVLDAIRDVMPYLNGILTEERKYDREEFGELVLRYRESARFALIEQGYLKVASHVTCVPRSGVDIVSGFGV